jgi:hypothetical protein
MLPGLVVTVSFSGYLLEPLQVTFENRRKRAVVLVHFTAVPGRN